MVWFDKWFDVIILYNGLILGVTFWTGKGGQN